MTDGRRRLTKRQARVAGDLIAGWRDDGTLDAGTARRLTDSYEVSSFDWKRLAKLSLIVSTLCMLTAVAAILDDKYLKDLLARLFDSPDWAKCAFFAVLAAALYGIGFRRCERRPENAFTNETILFLGVLSTAAAVVFLGAALSSTRDDVSLLMLLACAIYGVLGGWTGSVLIWVFALLSLGSWFGAKTGYISGWGAYYLGMNFPMRFVVFGLALCAASYGVERVVRLSGLARSTFVMGLLYLFVALWILSIFGNYGDEGAWREVRQIELFHWSALFAAAAGVAIWHGLKFDDAVSRGFGITFLFINLFTRFFEFFWAPLHKAVFFAILGALLWFLGSRAQKIWNLGQRSTGVENQTHGG